MNFLSTKTIRNIETAFSSILNPNCVNQGEKELIGLRERPDFELALSIFLSRCQNYEQRLLAVLQLKKLMIFTQEQSIWSLKEVYYSDSQKIAEIICEMMVKGRNAKWAGQFISCNFSNMGLNQVVRLIQLLFGLLKDPQSAVLSIELFFTDILTSLSQVFQIAQQNELIAQRIIIVLSLLYQNCINFNEDMYISKCRQNWQKISNYVNGSNLNLQPVIIIKLLYGHQPDFIEGTFYRSLMSVFNLQLRNDVSQLSYEVQSLRLFLKYCAIKQDYNYMDEFIVAINHRNLAIKESLLISLNINPNIKLQNMDESAQGQSQIQSILKPVIANYFQSYIQIYSNLYQLTGKTATDLLKQLIALLNYYQTTNSPNISNILNSTIDLALSTLQHYLSTHKINIQHKNQLIQTLNLIQLFTKYKTFIPSQHLTHVAFLIGQIPHGYVNISPLCYAFLEQIWQQIANLDFQSLTIFLFDHLTSVNKNEWGHSLSSYSCFLNLQQTLQYKYQFYSKTVIYDSLLQLIIETQKIMMSILIDSPQDQKDFEIIYKIINLTNNLLNKPIHQNLQSWCTQLNIPHLINFIQNYNLFSIDSACLITIHRHFSHTMMDHLRKDCQNWQIQEQDYPYQIQLYLYELDLASQFYCCELRRETTSLAQKIKQFRRQLTYSQQMQFSAQPFQCKSDLKWLLQLSGQEMTVREQN